jgi:plastocyanin
LVAVMLGTCDRSRMRRWITGLVVCALGVSGLALADASHAQRVGAAVPQKLHFEFGPLHITAGQNMIQYSSGNVPKPTVDGWIVGITPNLILPDNTVPPVDILHLHHAVWINQSRVDATSGGGERFFAVGEEKTALELPSGYGYKYRASDRWNINYMIHDLVDRPFDVRITYDITFIPAKNTKPLTSVVPIWMDVQNGSVYPVFDAHRGAGTNGQFTYPDPKNNPYRGRQKNKFTMPIGGTFVAAGGHLHPGGLWDDLYVDRGGKSAHVFRSNAKYFEPAGPVSWDVALGITRADWRLHVRAGDTLRLTATYDTSKRSWYEAMGILVAWFAPNQTKGIDPFAVKPVNMLVRYTHGHLPENNNHGGQADPDLADPATLPSGPLVKFITINYYKYSVGDLSNAMSIPTVHQGQSIRFTNTDAPGFGSGGTWHTITDCALPCNLTTGIAFPTADAPIEFDSGQLGNAGPPTAGRLTWNTPTNLPPGTYAYWCRVHPFMRGAFRVVP